MLETTPSVTMMAVMVRGGASCTILRIRASIRPDLSANPMPIIATRMIPTGPKFMKLATTEVEMKRIPSADNRPWTVVVTSSTSWVCGLTRRYVALTPSHCSTCESNTRTAVRRENSTAGCGTAFPTRSTVSRTRFISVARSAPAEFRSDEFEDALDRVCVVVHTQLVRDREEQGISRRDGLVAGELLNQRVGLPGV